MGIENYYCIKAKDGRVTRTSIWPLFKTTEIDALNATMLDATKVYAVDVIRKCYNKGLMLAGVSSEDGETLYHMVKATKLNIPQICET